MKSLVHGLLICAGAFAGLAHAQQEMPLYPGEIPGALAAPDEETLRERDPGDPYEFYQNISRPKIYPYLLSGTGAPRPAIVILPGGSYRGVSIVKEGFDVAKQLNAYGVVAFVVKYRTPSDRHMRDKTIAPLQDIQQAIRLVRQRAKQWNIDPHRVGVMGFSAGGHLAATAGTQFATPVLAGATAEEVRPDFLMLGYPVISFDDSITHRVSRETLLGRSPTRQQIERYSNELQVTSRTPPTFIVHAADDKGVVVENSLRLFEALHRNGVSSELIVFPNGGHGFGLNNSTTPDRWIERCRDWLLSRGYLRSEEMTG